MIAKGDDRVLLIDKPLGWTSFDVVNKLRHKLKIKKIGHAGTLDPLATGLLIICTGRNTKKIETFQALEKEYTGHFVIGQTTPSYDLETEPTPPVDISTITEEAILAAALSLTGEIEQIPPAHSAIKVSGKRAYELARKGKDIVLTGRLVTISLFEVMRIEKPRVYFRIVCSKGTYIRSIARDFGERLGVGAYLGELCRTRIGQHTLAQANRLEEVH